MPERYRELKEELQCFIPGDRLIDDPLRTLAYGTDASFYRLIPKLVVKVNDETEIIAILSAAHRLHTPVTFRAAGTSLSGQAISDSVLLVLSGDYWRNHSINADASIIK
ncbi:MAG: FAD-binding protein, partial [Sedimenticola sp.]|nr:FAD-binding protein [Sedimenticola sp.]